MRGHNHSKFKTSCTRNGFSDCIPHWVKHAKVYCTYISSSTTVGPVGLSLYLLPYTCKNRIATETIGKSKSFMHLCSKTKSFATGWVNVIVVTIKSKKKIIWVCTDWVNNFRKPKETNLPCHQQTKLTNYLKEGSCMKYTHLTVPFIWVLAEDLMTSFHRLDSLRFTAGLNKS